MHTLLSDTYTALDSFLDNELDISDASEDSLAVVVAEIVKGQAPASYVKQAHTTHNKFSSDFHTTFKSSDFKTATVVALFRNKRTNLHLWQDYAC